MVQVQRAHASGQLAPDDMVEIPEHVVVACPLVGFDLAPVSRCVDCKLFAGLEDRFPGSPHPFTKRFILKCLGEPVRRQMHNVVKG